MKMALISKWSRFIQEVPKTITFFKWTPFGHFDFGTVNQKAAKLIEEGKEYYIDISAAE